MKVNYSERIWIIVIIFLFYSFGEILKTNGALVAVVHELTWQRTPVWRIDSPPPPDGPLCFHMKETSLPHSYNVHIFEDTRLALSYTAALSVSTVCCWYRHIAVTSQTRGECPARPVGPVVRLGQSFTVSFFLMCPTFSKLWFFIQTKPKTEPNIYNIVQK